MHIICIEDTSGQELHPFKELYCTSVFPQGTQHITELNSQLTNSTVYVGRGKNDTVHRKYKYIDI